MSIVLGDKSKRRHHWVYRDCSFAAGIYLDDTPSIGVQPRAEDGKQSSITYVAEERLIAKSIAELQMLKGIVSFNGTFHPIPNKGPSEEPTDNISVGLQEGDEEEHGNP